MKTYHFGQMDGFGLKQEAPEQTSCFASGFAETNSFWITWTAATPGTLTFVINPNNVDDDFDFVLYRKSDANCQKMEEVRCMAAGQNIGDAEDINTKCKGRTFVELC
jgi:hypothetical protein